MLSKIIKNTLESYGINQNMVDKVKAVVDNIDVREVDDQIHIEVSLKKLKIIVEKDKEKGEE